MNQKNMTRILFGSETKLDIPRTCCPGCNASRGNYHAYGCPVETCPECGGRLLHCDCLALSMLDEMRITKAVAATLTRDQVLKMTEKSETLNETYFAKSAFSWIILNAPPELEKEMEAWAFEILGARKQNGMMVVPADKAAEALGMSKEDADVVMRGLEADCLYPGWDDSTGDPQ